MTDKFVMDACALIAFFYKEEGGQKVKDILEEAQKENAEIFMNKLNVLEVYYNIYKSEGLLNAEKFFQHLFMLPIAIIENISDEVLREAGRLKANYRMSLADAIAVGEAVTRGAAVVTSDHHEFDIIEKNENIVFKWIR